MQTIITPWQLNHIDQQLIDIALAEDLGLPMRDLTTDLLLQTEGDATARVISKQAEPVVICGLPIVQAILATLCASLNASSGTKRLHAELMPTCHDGDVVNTKQEILQMRGSPTVLLMAERTLLNFMQRLSAIATTTAKYVAKIKHTNAKILDTRKTLPGFRHLEKYAVTCGGGVNHRMGLYDAIMIKDTHIDVLGGMQQALAKLPEDILKRVPVIVEVRNKQELEVVLTHALHKTTRVLLDNMSVELMRECVLLCKDKIPTECSGNVTLDTIQAIAETGVDFISVGRITHSAGNVDLSMKCDLKHG